jgi:hypothetical protein
MTGTLMNSLDTVIGVVLNPSYPGSSYSPDGAFIYDNAQYSSQPYLDNPGVLFTTAANHPPSGGYWNLFSNGSDPYDLYESVPSVGYTIAETGTLTVTLASGVPEASTWAMMALGFAGLSVAGCRRTVRLKSSAA